MAFALRASGFQKGEAMAPHASTDPAVAINLALALVAASTAPVLLLDKDFHIVAASKSFCVAFQADASKIAGCSLDDIGDGEWRVPQLTSLLKSAAAGYVEIESYELDLVRPGRETRQLVISAKKLNYDGQEDTQIIMSIADITDAREAAKLKEKLLREKEGLLRDKDIMLSPVFFSPFMTISARRLGPADS
jgi:PAS domain-containing protein